MNHLVATYGYAIVALFVLVESLGIPLPGETAVIAAGAYAGSTHRLSAWLIFACAAAAAIAGDNIGFEIGKVGGYRLLRHYGRYVHLDERRVKVGRYVFDRHGSKVVFFGRFVSLLRTYAAFLAGTNRMKRGRFMVWNAAGGIIWAAVYTIVSYNAGTFLERSSGTITVVVGVVAVVVIVASVLVIRRRTDSLTDKAEAAYPGPLDDAAA